MYPSAYGYYPVYPAVSYPPYFRSEAEATKEQAVLPKNVMYTTKVEPVFTEHLMKHKGQQVCIATTIGKLEGTLDGVFIDHVGLITPKGKLHHIRLCEIVYFEKA